MHSHKLCEIQFELWAKRKMKLFAASQYEWVLSAGFVCLSYAFSSEPIAPIGMKFNEHMEAMSF